MNTSSFLIWVIFVGAIAAFAVINMSQAYVGSGSLAVVFLEPIFPTSSSATDSEVALLPPVSLQQSQEVQQGNEAFQAGNYRKAADRFAAAIQLNPNFAEAHHNRGRAIANLRSDNEAASILVKAGELYLQQDNAIGYEQVKQDLKLLKEKRIEEKALKEKTLPEQG